MSVHELLVGWAVCCIVLWVAAKYLEWVMIKKERDRYGR